MHACPECGALHLVGAPTRLCVCGHLWGTHNDNGGRLRKAYCTVWVPAGAPTAQCACIDFTEA